MRIFRALGLGVAIVVLKLLVPEVMHGLERTLSAFFGLATTLFANVETAVR